MSGLITASSIPSWPLLLGCALLTLLAVLFILLPLLRRPAKHEVSADHQDRIDLSLYREALAKLEQSRAVGELDDAEYHSAKVELDQRLVTEAGQEQGTEPVNSRRWPWLIVVLVGLPVMAVLIYIQIGSMMMPDLQAKSAESERLVARLAQRMQSRPDDVEGWILLARSYYKLGQFDQALAAIRQANERSDPPNVAVLLAEVEMLAKHGRGNIPARAEQLLQRALNHEPDNAGALWTAGLIAREQGKTEQALDYWKTLHQQDLPAEFRHSLEEEMATLGWLPQASEGAGNNASSEKTVINLIIEADPALLAGLPDNARVFVYAHAAEANRGMPLAVSVHSVDELPLTLALSDRHSMTGVKRLSDANAWRIGARISTDDDATASRGDPFGEIALNRSTLEADPTASYRININQRLP